MEGAYLLENKAHLVGLVKPNFCLLFVGPLIIWGRPTEADNLSSALMSSRSPFVKALSSTESGTSLA